MSRRFVTLAATLAGVAAMTCPVASAAADSCPNAAYRTGAGASLPDCRAYELVSGAFFEGMPSITAGFGLPVSGSAVVATNLGAGAGTDANNGLYGSDYEFTRTAGGWTATPLDPPTAGYQDSTVDDVSSDFSTALLTTSPPGAEGAASDYGSLDSNLVLRQADGDFSAVGPLTPTPGATYGPVYMGASADLATVVFALDGGVWPQDTTDAEDRSLYEYTGTGNATPQLVGVDDSGTLISDCGTWLGSYNGSAGSTYNAISSSGGTVYFTAVGPCSGSQLTANQLYARIDGAETTEISAPSPDGCTSAACLSAPAADAFFEGASSDGSKAFFASTGQLLDTAAEDDTAGDTAEPGSSAAGCANTAGAAGCNLYEYDFDAPAGQNLVLVSAGSADPQVQGVARISADGSHVYFVAKGVLATNAGAAIDADTGGPEYAAAGADNLYVFERDASYPDGQTTFIAQLNPADKADWSPSDARPVQATPDGDYLVFSSAAELTPDDDSSVQQIFEYDALSGTLVRVSQGQDGYNGDGNTTTQPATLPEQLFSAGGSIQEAQLSSLAVSGTGSVVVFSSSDALTPAALDDPSGKDQNVYEWEAPGDGSCAATTVDGCVFLISDGHDDQCAAAGLACGSTLWGLDPSGQDIFFSTSDPLVAQDTNTQSDIYDARVDGGFAAPAAAASCSGDACQGASPPSVAAPVAATVSFSGPGNATVPIGTVKVVGRSLARTTFALDVRVSAGGGITVRGADVSTLRHRAAKGGTYRLTVSLSAKGRRALKRKRILKVAVQVWFTPSGASAVGARVSVTLRERRR